MYDYRLLEAFAAVIETGGFEKAAEKLFITQSAVSQRIRQLEDMAKTVLLVRSSPPVPTDKGRLLLAHFNKVRLMETDVETELHTEKQDEYTSICIGLNADTLATWFFDAVSETAAREKILLDIKVDDQEETHRMLKNGEAAGCISARSAPMQGCSVHYLLKTVYRMYVSPEKKKIFFPDGFTLENLKKTPVIVYNSKDTLHTQLFRKAFGKTDVEHPAHYIPSVEKYLDAVVRGMGIGMMPHHQCQSLFDAKILADAAEPYTVEADLYWHRWNIRSRPLDMITKSLLRFCKT